MNKTNGTMKLQDILMINETKHCFKTLVIQLNYEQVYIYRGQYKASFTTPK